MAERQPLRATFFTLQHRPRAVLAPATLVLAALLAVLLAAFVGLNWSALRELPNVFKSLPLDSEKPDPALAMSFVAHIFGLLGWLFLLLVPFFMLLAAYEAACLRWMIRGEAPGIFGITFNSADTWRVYCVYWCWAIGQYAVSLVMSFLMMPFMLASMAPIITAAGHGDPATIWRWQLTAQFPLMLAHYAPLLFLSVRFAPAAATSVARRRFSFFEAWHVSRNRYLALFGSLALLWVIMAGACAIVFGLVAWPVLARLWPQFPVVWIKPSLGLMQKYFAALFAPATIALVGVGYVAQALIYSTYKLMSFGVNARAALVALEEGKIKVEPASD